MPEVTLESEEWYVLGNWLRERENRLMYALRPKSDEWEFVHDLRRTIERQYVERQHVERQQDGRSETTGTADRAGTTEPTGTADRAETTETPRATEATGATETAKTTETAGTTETVRFSDRQMAYLSSFLRRRARKLLLFPWRSRERRDVRHLRDHLLHEAGRSDDAAPRSVATGQRRG